jgi:hypothetical protein
MNRGWRRWRMYPARVQGSGLGEIRSLFFKRASPVVPRDTFERQP